MTNTTLAKENVGAFQSVISLVKEMKNNGIEHSFPKGETILNDELREVLIDDEHNVFLVLADSIVLLPQFAKVV